MDTGILKQHTHTSVYMKRTIGMPWDVGDAQRHRYSTGSFPMTWLGNLASTSWFVCVSMRKIFLKDPRHLCFGSRLERGLVVRTKGTRSARGFSPVHWTVCRSHALTSARIECMDGLADWLHGWAFLRDTHRQELAGVYYIVFGSFLSNSSDPQHQYGELDAFRCIYPYQGPKSAFLSLNMNISHSILLHRVFLFRK